MQSLNKVLLIGDLDADPEMRYTGQGDAVCTIRLATKESWKDKGSGETKERTEWHRVVLFRELAEVAGRTLKKGARVFFEGKNRTRKWQDKDGADRYTTEVEVFTMLPLDARDEEVPDNIKPVPRKAQGGIPNGLGDDIPFAPMGYRRAAYLI